VVIFEQFWFSRRFNIVTAEETNSDATNHPSRRDPHEGLAQDEEAAWAGK
jgi:hypothetical protein